MALFTLPSNVRYTLCIIFVKVQKKVYAHHYALSLKLEATLYHANVPHLACKFSTHFVTYAL